MQHKTINIGKTKIGPSQKPYLIAEIGNNHQGDLQKAFDYVNLAKSCGANCVKFQIFNPENLIDINEKLLPGVKIKGIKTQYERFKSTQLNSDEFRQIAKYAKEKEIDFTASAWDKESVDLLCELDVPFIKIGSGDITNIPLLRYIATKNLTVVFSTAGANIKEIKKAYHIFKNLPTVIMHCTFPYPTPAKNLNLAKIPELSKLGSLVGYSDHTTNNDACIHAVALGACMIEKHFAQNPNEEQTGDHKVSANPTQLKNLADALIKNTTRLGKKDAALSAQAKHITQKARRAIYLTQDLEKGTQIREEHLKAIRPENKGIPVSQWDFVIGLHTTKKLLKNTFLQKDNLK